MTPPTDIGHQACSSCKTPTQTHSTGAFVIGGPTVYRDSQTLEQRQVSNPRVAPGSLLPLRACQEQSTSSSWPLPLLRTCMSTLLHRTHLIKFHTYMHCFRLIVSMLATSMPVYGAYHAVSRGRQYHHTPVATNSACVDSGSSMGFAACFRSARTASAPRC